MFAKPKKRSNDGHSSQGFNARPRLPKVLEDAYLAERAKEADARHQERLKKKDPSPKGSPKRSLPDAVVLAIRALREYRGWSARQLAAVFQIPDWKAHQIVSYTTMLDLVPGEQHVPADAVKPVLPDGRGKRRKRPAMTMSGTLRTLDSVRAEKNGVDLAELRIGEGG